MLPKWLEDELVDHRLRYLPVWRGFLSDHLPMSSMAMWRLGYSQNAIQKWMASYRRLLDLSVPTSAIGQVEEGYGELNRFRSLVEFFDAQQAQSGSDATILRFLPDLLSAWGSDAFHPMIRLGYAIRFQVTSEISAALAYFAVKGPNYLLEKTAQKAVKSDIVWPASVELINETFDEIYNDVLRHADYRVALPPDVYSSYALELLDIFMASQDFFALHLVTGTHAFMCVDEKYTLKSPGLYAGGILAGYLAAGAPAFKNKDPFQPARFGFEHDVKLAFTLDEMASRTGSDKYREAANIFIQRLPPVEVGLEEIRADMKN